jgi:Dolichyl-phosphate-mannose-protein mannosyltransferase
MTDDPPPPPEFFELDSPLRSLALLRGALVVCAVMVGVQAALGFAGVLGQAPAALAVLGTAFLLGVSVSRWRRSRSPRVMSVAPNRAGGTAPWTAGAAAGAAALGFVFCERLWTGLHRSTFLYDVLSYHLHVPASWRVAGRLGIVPTPFGDPAPAYAPSNAELSFHLILAATGNATLAHVGQLPFAMLAALAIYATARVLGAVRSVGFGAALVFLLIPEVWQQATTAMADLALASFFLAAIPFLLRLARRRSWSDVIGFGLALGLLIGTKYAAAVLSIPIVGWALVGLTRRRPGMRRASAFGVLGALVLGAGGFWYLRNLIATGNPIYPATLRLGSLTLAQGLYDWALIRTSPYHLPAGDLQALLEILADPGWAYWGAVILAAAIARRTVWPHLALVMVLLGWFAIPYQQSRFFFPAWGAYAVLLAAAATVSPRIGKAALAAATLGSIIQFPTTARVALLGVAGLGAAVGPRLIATAERLEGRAPFATFASAVTLPCLLLLALLAWAHTRTDAPPYAVGDHHDQGWAWIRAHAHGRHIAYSGSNLPLPLWGPLFENDAQYVNVSNRPSAAAHEFPINPPGSIPAASAEPAPERATPNQATWLSNLDARHIDLVFIAALYPDVRATIAHDEDGFPIEREWADQRKDRFSLSFAEPGIRIYAYHRSVAP